MELTFRKNQCPRSGAFAKFGTKIGTLSFVPKETRALLLNGLQVNGGDGD